MSGVDMPTAESHAAENWQAKHMQLKLASKALVTDIPPVIPLCHFAALSLPFWERIRAGSLNHVTYVP
jgi:hypothetical protein